MSIPNYSVLKGDPQPGKVTGFHPHFRIPVETDNGNFTIDVNIESFDNSEVLYAIIEKFTPPDAQALLALPDGVTKLASQPGGLVLDFVRETIGAAPMIASGQMTLLPVGREQDLHDRVVTVVKQAIEDENGLVYAFGSPFADPGGVDGIHDIHVNQGNPLRNHGKDNGVWQDGALFPFLPARNQWIAVFIAFQTQSWQTDDQGDPSESGAARHRTSGRWGTGTHP